ncbi:WcaI family glycosyltransferase [Parapedobacter tibetensis]|uniref:WcaI family glycosyltransferase n=1 Tax=Parapedobacter tibetensis TaxID=2972951 RepID=UPI00214D6415|nr:WcaI family glycosyltransferase [Parapedobacter tibetensis]
MRILIYGINYAPELTGIGKYTGEMGAWLASHGHTVHVVTAMPYYPEWSVHESHKGKYWHTEHRDGVKIYRCPLYVPKSVSSLRRILHEFSFVASVFPIWFTSLFRKRYDAVICTSPPFHLAVLPLLYARIRRAKFITHIQDLQVDAAKDLGMIRNKGFLNILFGLERFLLKSSTAVSTISHGMQKKIVAKGINAEKLIMFPNWVDETLIRPLPVEQSLRNELGIPLDHQVVLYSGNLGEKQGLEIIIGVAKQLEYRKDLHFVICGSGGGRPRLEKLTLAAGLTNIRFLPLQPYEKLSALLATADIHLVLQKKSAADLVMPSKLTGILAAGGCALVTASPGTSLYEVVMDYNLGIIIEPESEQDLLAGLLTALNGNLEEYRANARAYAVEQLSKQTIMERFERSLETL